jgi:hypothetical protein
MVRHFLLRVQAGLHGHRDASVGWTGDDKQDPEEALSHEPDPAIDNRMLCLRGREGKMEVHRFWNGRVHH